ncbi:BCCT family transporter, partial [Proteus terrae]|uniref:BCCT family transporter n=1 Tax=Proteus terrae TaxID=1574161 RepID=UPI0033153E08
GLILLSVIMAVISATSGVNKGIRILSELNVLLAIGLILFILFSGDSALYEVIHGNKELAKIVLEAPEKGFYSLLELYPGFGLTASVA